MKDVGHAAAPHTARARALTGASGVVVARLIARLNIGGPALQAIYLTEAASDRHRTVLVTGEIGAGEGDWLPLARERGLQPHVVRGLGREIDIWQDLSVLWRLIRLLRTLAPRIVHTHTAKAGTLGRIAAIVARVPIRVHTFHGHVFHGYFGPRKTWLFLMIERLLARHTTRIVAISEHQRDDLVGRYRICPPERVAVIPLGIDLDRYRGVRHTAARSEFRGETGVAERGALVVVVGRLVPIKRHDLLLQAAALLSETRPDCVLAIVGDGSERTRLVELAARLGLSSRVRFLGWRSDLTRVYAGADVVALSSANEGTPVCLLEAMTAGCPVVATAVGGVPDVLENGRLGTLVPAGDAQALAEALAGALRCSNEITAMARRAEASIPARYHHRRLLADVETLYDDLLAASPERTK